MKFVDYWRYPQSPHSMCSRVYVTVECLSVRPSVRPSVPSIDISSGWFAAERGRLQQSIYTARTRSAANAGSVMLRAEWRVSIQTIVFVVFVLTVFLCASCVTPDYSSSRATTYGVCVAFTFSKRVPVKFLTKTLGLFRLFITCHNGNYFKSRYQYIHYTDEKISA